MSLSVCVSLSACASVSLYVSISVFVCLTLCVILSLSVWGQEEKGTTEDEMAGWHHRLDGRESE